MHMMEKMTMYLPHELIIPVLLRLPVKSLLSFKCVCKLWLTLISDPDFANSHFKITATTHNHRILLVSCSAHVIRSIDFEASLDDHSDFVSPNLNFLQPHQYYYLNLDIKGSCGGYIVLHCRGEQIYLWNPSTGIHKKIPLSQNDYNLEAKHFCYLYGFGYDKSRDDYLLVLMSYDVNLANISSHLEFFSLRDNKWKELEGNHFPYMEMKASSDPRVGPFFNGAIHRLAFRPDIAMNVIIAFDLMERKLLHMHLPDGFCCHPNRCDLWVFGEFLSLWVLGYDGVEIWVMKEYKVKSSWTKTLVLPIDGNPIRYFIPLCCTKSGDIVGRDGCNGLVKYNAKGQLLEHHFYSNNNRNGSQMIMYTESLLSPPSLISELKKMTQTIRRRKRSTRRRLRL